VVAGMSGIALGQPVPDFELPASDGRPIRLSEFAGRKVVLYFYPKDNTPGCTREGQDFRDLHEELLRHGAVVLGVSRDSVASHASFKAKQALPYELLSDADESVCRLFDVIRERYMYGRRVMGVQRSTFLIDDQGRLRREWRKVRVDGHAAEVLEAVKAL
jgi:thioredoxin-dependent peroxiredoxin